jgi:mRNA interferase RelE/StbE
LYKIELTNNSKKELDALDKQIKSFVLKSLAEFETNFDAEYENNLIKTGKIKALKGEWSGFYRLKLRTYRVIYAKEADKLIILIVRISHRKDVYG